MKEVDMATRQERRPNVGATLSAVLVLAGVATMIFGSIWIGIAATAVGLAALGVVALR
jgi:CHASE2 domain-containing sensor protein